MILYRNVVVALFIAALSIAMVSSGATAGELSFTILDRDRNPVEGVVVSADLIGGSLPESNAKRTPQKFEVAQENKRFTPYILPITVGDWVDFPNLDDIKHHIYSFSKPKIFEINLYKGRPPEPVLFDKPGIVTIGCNIHDYMIAYIYVADTPYIGKTDDNGLVTLPLAAGDYQVKIWNPRLSDEDLSRVMDLRVKPDMSLKSIQLQGKLRKDLDPTKLADDHYDDLGGELDGYF